jgi:hypothetical protein
MELTKLFVIGIIICSLFCDARAQEGGSHPISNAELIISSNKNEIYRGEEILVTIQLKNIGDDPIVEGYLRLNIPQFQEIKKIFSASPEARYNFSKEDNSLKIYYSKLNEGDSASVTYISKISAKAELGYQKIVALNAMDFRITPRVEYIISSIEILNNIPTIVYANVSLLSPCTYDDKMEAFIPDNYNNPIRIKINAKAQDVESNTLLYRFIIKRNNIEYYQIDQDANRDGTISFDYALSNFNIGENYSFFVQVYDSEEINSITSSQANIYYNSYLAKSIFIAPWSYYQSNEILSVGLAIISLIISLYTYLAKTRLNVLPSLKRRSLSKFTKIIVLTKKYSAIGKLRLFLFSESRELLLFAILVTWIYVKSQYYLNYFVVFVLYVYLIVLIIFVYFARKSFDNILGINKQKLYLINIFFMGLIVYSINNIIFNLSSLDIEAHMSSYYSGIGQIFATIFAILAAFYTSAPKNILNINNIDKYTNRKDLYPFPTMLHHFIIVYGSIVALSLWGLSAGTMIKFTPTIEINLENFPNLVSIFVFSATLMLIPPAITCLYELMRLVIFRTQVTIESKPPGGHIYIKVNSYDFDTGLATPSALLIAEDSVKDLKLIIKKEHYTDYPLDVEFCDGTDQVFFVDLIHNGNHSNPLIKDSRY